MLAMMTAIWGRGEGDGEKDDDDDDDESDDNNRVPTGPEKSWNLPFDCSGPEKSWICT